MVFIPRMIQNYDLNYDSKFRSQFNYDLNHDVMSSNQPTVPLWFYYPIIQSFNLTKISKLMAFISQLLQTMHSNLILFFDSHNIPAMYFDQTFLVHPPSHFNLVFFHLGFIMIN